MCELLGMSANVPTDICFSFTGLMQRGGGTGPHRDGWGIAFYEGRGCRAFHDPTPSVDSEIAELVRRYPIKSHIVISHIRQANSGPICLANTHPFQRELWGRVWTFAHNGELANHRELPLGSFRPVGSTDSEHAFCWLLGQIRERFDAPPQDAGALHGFMQSSCEQLRERGICNLLLSDSEYLYAYCSTRLHWITRRAPFGVARLSDADMAVDFGQETTPDDVVTVVSTEPLTDNEHWTRMSAGELVCFRGGEVE